MEQMRKEHNMKTTKIARLVALSAVFVVAASLSIGNVHASQPVVTSVDVPLCAKASNEVHCYAVEHRFFVNGVAEKNYSQLQTDLSKMGFTLDQIQSSSTPCLLYTSDAADE